MLTYHEDTTQKNLIKLLVQGDNDGYENCMTIMHRCALVSFAESAAKQKMPKTCYKIVL